jgi:hypothetical protein
MDRTTLQNGCGMLDDARQRLGGRIAYGSPSRNRPSTDGFRPCGGVNPKVIPWPNVIPHPKRLPSAVLAWNDGTVVKLAQGIEQRLQTADLPILADALEEAGWDYAIILRQLRTKPDTARWVLDWILRPGEMEEETFHRNILGCWTIADFIQRGGGAGLRGDDPFARLPCAWPG